MRTFPIEQVPDDDLPKLSPRCLGQHSVLVTLEDCAPFLTSQPLQLDELWSVLVRLLIVLDGPLVSSNGTPRGTRMRDLLWHVADKHPDALTLTDIGLWAKFDDTMKPGDLAHVRHLVGLGVTHRLITTSWQPWWSHAKDLLELAVWHHPVDAMLAGLPAKEDER